MKREVTRDEFIRKRIERQRRIRKRRLIAFFVIFIITLLCVGAVLCFTVFFPIVNITAKGSKIYSAEEILIECDIKKGENLFSVNRAKTENRLKTKLPFIEGISFNRELPGNLIITVKDAEEFACYVVDGVFYTVSAKGWVLEKNIEQPENLLIINAPNIKCKVGSEIEFKDGTQKDFVDGLITALNEEKLIANGVDITDALSIKLKVENRFEVNLGTANNLAEKISHLKGMIKEIPDEKVGKINLSMWTSDNKNGTFVAENQ